MRIDQRQFDVFFAHLEELACWPPSDFFVNQVGARQRCVDDLAVRGLGMVLDYSARGSDCAFAVKPPFAAFWLSGFVFEHTPFDRRR